jgi:hypothetical protein
MQASQVRESNRQIRRSHADSCGFHVAVRRVAKLHDPEIETRLTRKPCRRQVLVGKYRELGEHT